jgi:hypothetical protein
LLRARPSFLNSRTRLFGREVEEIAAANCISSSRVDQSEVVRGGEAIEDERCHAWNDPLVKL